MKDLQAIIDKKAEDRLDKDIKDIIRAIKTTNSINIFTTNTFREIHYKIQNKSEPLTSGLDNEYRDIWVHLKKELLPKYKEEEADAFVKEVKELKDKLSTLLIENN